MTTKTIPEYLEDERQKYRDDQLRMKEEAARIQPLHHGHHRATKEHAATLPTVVEVAPKTTNSSAAVAKKPRKITARAHKAA